MHRVTQRGPVAYALMASLVMHASGLAWLLMRHEAVRPSLPDNALSVLLQQAEPPAEPITETPPQQPEVAQQPPQTPAPAVVAPTVETTAALETPARIKVEPQASPRPKLDLSRPKDWDTLATESPETLTSFGFKKSHRQAIAQRQEERARARVLTRAQIARLGLSEDHYRRRTGEGEHVKTSKGCFVKRVENGAGGPTERWWRTRCRDSKVPEWRREVLTFDADHRVSTEAPVDFESPEAGVEP